MEKKTARLEAFSDGIFGVAITLLAIEIGIKEYEGATNANLVQENYFIVNFGFSLNDKWFVKSKYR